MIQWYLQYVWVHMVQVSQTSNILALLTVMNVCLHRPNEQQISTIHDDLCSNMHLFQALFLDFQIQQLAILKPVEVGKSYIPQKKALMIDTFIYLYSGLRLLCHLAACTALLFQVLLPDPSIIKGLCVVLVCLEELHASQPDRFFNHKQFF